MLESGSYGQNCFPSILMTKRLKEISLKVRLAVGLGSMVLPIAIIGGASIVMFQGALSTFEQTEEERREVLFPLVDLDSSITKASDFVGAQNFGSEKSLATQPIWRSLKDDVLRKLKSVEGLPSSTPVERALIKSVENDLQSGISNVDSLYDSLSEFEETTVLDRQKVAHANLVNALEGVRNTHYSLTAWSAKENIQRAEDFKSRFRWMIFLIILLILFLAIFAALVLTRSILKPISQMKEGLEHFAKGDLSYRIQVDTHDEIELLAESMNSMAASLEESQIQLKELAIRDELTGLLNRREFNRLLNIEVERSIRDCSPVSLIMLDLDRFKVLNDSYGHQVGDIALETIANLLMGEIRPGDYGARFGGEEFSIILPNADIDHALAVAERIRAAVEQEPVYLPNGEEIHVTASLGCASFPSHAQSESSLLTQADKALYQAKAQGRNLVLLAQPLVTVRQYA